MLYLCITHVLLLSYENNTFVIPLEHPCIIRLKPFTTLGTPLWHRWDMLGMDGFLELFKHHKVHIQMIPQIRIYILILFLTFLFATSLFLNVLILSSFF
jgi:hypothetical protein